MESDVIAQRVMARVVVLGARRAVCEPGGGHPQDRNVRQEVT